MLKRIFDILISLLMLILLIPVMLIVAVAIRIKLGPPVIFKQMRPGLHGKPFYLFKFRTMSEERDKNGVLLSDEQRLGTFGLKLRQLSLDELPQLFNVLRGDMSLVGPRPLLMEYLPLYTKEQARRHEVRPGITGWAQINGRNAISWEEKFKYDVWYVDHRSFLLDMKILLKTMMRVVRREGISKEGYSTTDHFKGAGL